ncbi:MAG: hypothetical protein AAF318_04610 [Pseudomonadota bacterium]
MRGNWMDPQRVINTVGRVDTPMESRRLREWAKIFRPKISPGWDIDQGRSLADTPQQAIAKHAKMLSLATDQLGKRDWDNR